MRFDHEALGGDINIGLELLEVGGEKNHIEKLLEVLVLFGGNRHHGDVATPFLGLEAMLGEVSHSTWDVGAFTVDFIDGDDNFSIGRLGEIDGFDSLWLDTIISSNHNNDDIGQHSAMLTNGGEGLVTRGVKKCDETVIVFELIGRNMLCDAAGFVINGLLVKESVEKGGLAVVNVAHDGNHGRTPDGFVG